MRLCRARKTMVYWAKVRNDQVEESIGAQIVAEARQLKKQMSLASEIGTTVGEEGQKAGQKVKAAAGSGDEGAAQKAGQKAGPAAPVLSGGSPKLHRAGRKKRKASTNALFAMILFQEFLRELAAISQQHASLYPCVHVFNSDPVVV